VLQDAELSGELTQRTTSRAPQRLVLRRTGRTQEEHQLLRKDAVGQVYQEGKVSSTRRDLDGWVRTLPQPRMIVMGSTIFTGSIYDCLLPHATR